MLEISVYAHVGVAHICGIIHKVKGRQMLACLLIYLSTSTVCQKLQLALASSLMHME